MARGTLNCDQHADVAQLVEHFTRNEGVHGSNPRVGFATTVWPREPSHSADTVLGLSTDIHTIWRIAANNWRSMKEHAPAGYEPVTRVYLVGSTEAIPVGYVETVRGTDITMLDVVMKGSDIAEAHPGNRFIFVYDRNVAHIEIIYQRIGDTPVGFSVAEGDANAGSE